MRIGLDYDSVITDSRKLKAHVALERYGVKVPWRMFKRYTVVPGGYLTGEQADEIARDVHNHSTLNEMVPAVPGAIEGIYALLKQGHEVQVVTGRDGKAADYARKWLTDHEIDIPLAGVGHRNSKRAATQGLDVFVDDDLDKLTDLGVRDRFLFSWEYNLHLQPPENIKRVHSWKDLRQRINEIGGRKTVILQPWTESERGWGTRPDGHSLHLTMKDRDAYVKSYNDELPAAVPHEYSFASGEPREHKVDANLYEEVRRSKFGVRYW